MQVRINLKEDPIEREGQQAAIGATIHSASGLPNILNVKKVELIDCDQFFKTKIGLGGIPKTTKSPSLGGGKDKS